MEFFLMMFPSFKLCLQKMSNPPFLGVQASYWRWEGPAMERQWQVVEKPFFAKLSFDEASGPRVGCQD